MILLIYSYSRGTAVAQGCVLQIGRLLVRFQVVPLEFFIDIILPIALWHSASNRYEYQEYLLGVKAAGA